MAVGLTVINDLEMGGVHFMTMNSIKVFKTSLIFVIVLIASKDFP